MNSMKSLPTQADNGHQANLREIIDGLSARRDSLVFLTAAADARHYLQDMLDRPNRAAEKLTRALALIDALLSNDPNDCAADGIALIDVWRKEAAALRA